MLVLARGATAEVIDMPPAPPVDPDRGNFWRDMLWPHKDEVDSIVGKARLAIQNADMGLYADYDPTGVERLRFYRETYGPLRHARTLAPENLEVLRLLGQVADEHGHGLAVAQRVVATTGMTIAMTAPDSLLAVGTSVNVAALRTRFADLVATARIAIGQSRATICAGVVDGPALDVESWAPYPLESGLWITPALL